MPELPLMIPTIGEGLQEARVVAFLKQPGDVVKRDEAIYQMETDKAVMDVESPYAGTIKAWTAQVDDIVAIGAQIGTIETSEGAVADSGPGPEPAVEAEAGGTPGVVSLRIPAIGEGLQEARLVARLKQPGDTIRRDEAIYQMETDKAVMDVESPVNGKVVEWLAEVDEVLAIGAEVLRVETDEQVSGSEPSVAAPAAAASEAPAVSQSPGEGRRRDIPPRTRAYAKSKGVTEDVLQTIFGKGSKLMPEDIDAHLAGGSAAVRPAVAKGDGYSEEPMSSRQRVLSSRLVRGNQLVVPGMMSVVCDWGGIERVRERIKAGGGDFQPSTFTIFAYAVGLAAGKHPIVRSTLVGDSVVRTYDHIQLGIAVSLPGDQLVVAVVKDADALSWTDFAVSARSQIELARGGKDQADESVTLSITNMQGYGIRDAMAVVVPPGVATIFLGEPYNGLANTPGELKLMRCANVGITIDHRLINGVGGAEFLNEIKSNVESIEDILQA